MGSEPTYGQLVQHYAKRSNGQLARIVGTRASDYTEVARRAAHAVLATRDPAVFVYDPLDAKERMVIREREKSDHLGLGYMGCSLFFFSIMMVLAGLEELFQSSMTSRDIALAAACIVTGAILAVVLGSVYRRGNKYDEDQIDPDELRIGEIKEWRIGK